MSSLFWLDVRPIEQDANNLLRWRTWRPGHATQKHSSVVLLPAFSFTSVTPWLGASFIIVEFNATASAPFAILGPIVPPTNTNFCLALRWYTGDLLSSYSVHRYKLWQNVGEDLDYPLYGGQTIPTSFALEIWTTESNTEVSLATAIQLITSLLYNPTECCDETTPVESVASEYCELFSCLPAGAPTVEYLRNEDGSIILNEDGQPIIVT